MFREVKILLRHPIYGFKKIIPFLKSKYLFYKRKFLELLKIDSLSKPYSNHDKLLKHLNFRNGFFVECGGNDGYAFDPTYYFEKFMNWGGILIEPLPRAFFYCNKNRTKSTVYNYALVSDKYREKDIVMCDCNAMSVVKESFDGYEDWVKLGEKAQSIKSKDIMVPAITLQSLLDNYFIENEKRNIDLLVLDVEGYEYEILQGLDFYKNKPSYLLIEMQTDERKMEIENFIRNFGYSLLDDLDGKDFLYILKN